MNTAIVNIKVDPTTKRKAQKIAEELGFSLSSLVKAYLRQLIKTKTVIFSAASEEPSEYLIKMLRESEEDIKRGRVISFKTPQKSLDYLDEMIANEKKATKN